MICWREGTVTGHGERWRDALELSVDMRGPDGVRPVRALAYPGLVGTPEIGDRVLLNATALLMGLGTGGYAMVVALPDRLPDDPPPAPGHLVKGRYTPLQGTVLGVDEQESPHHAALATADDLEGLPVVVADLHSALPAVLAGVRDVDPTLRCVYVMTDGGALPIAFSRTVAALADAGWLVSTVTVGQAYGGTMEAVTLHSGLLAARHVARADVVVVAQGPGNLGTGTRWGFSGVACGEAVNAAGLLHGRAVAALRVSQVDARERHRGVSHHSLTAYGRVALTPADVVVPLLGGDFGARVRAQAGTLSPPHSLVDVAVDGLGAALAQTPVPLSTMGRGPSNDEAAFLASAAAGRHAGTLARP
ncbi:MAG: DUF3866 family protein [Nocardioidaceae bacterium]